MSTALPPPPRAVFLSYASEDAETARRISESLRQAGVEVWFDQNELRGGDAWDAKIRGQIASCALFVPVISAATQARREGYFRIEWKLAAQRTHAMADGTPFLLPIVIDATRDAEALVPAEFKAVQWTRVSGADTLEALAARVVKLLAGDSGAAAGDEPTRATRVRVATGGEGMVKRRRAAWPWALGAGAVLALGAVGFFAWQARRSPQEVAAPSPAREWVAKARALYEPWDGATREDFALAEQFVKKALELDATDADALAAHGVIACGQMVFGYDRSAERRELARTAAERAVKLAPGSNQAAFAQAFYFRFNDATRAEAERRLRELAGKMPENKLVLRTLGSELRNQGRIDEALALYDQAAALPGGDPVALYNKFLTLDRAHRYAEAEAALDQSLALKATAYGYRAKAMVLLTQRGDLDGAAAAVAKIAPAFLLEDAGAYWVSKVWFWRREPARALVILAAVARDILGNDFDGPTAFLAGQAHDLAGRPDAARAEWRAALGVAERQLLAQPNAARWVYWRAVLLAYLDQADEAARALQAFEGMSGRRGPTEETIPIYLRLGRREEVLASLEARIGLVLADGNAGSVAIVRNQLRFDPVWDTLRGSERFEAVRRQFDDDSGGAGKAKRAR